MRVINFKTKNDPTKPLYKCKNILPLEENIIYSKGKFIWRLTHECQPKSVKALFSSHGASLSFRDIDKQFLKLKLPFQRTDKGLKYIIDILGLNFGTKIFQIISKLGQPFSYLKKNLNCI